MPINLTQDRVGLLTFMLSDEDGTPLEGTAPGQLFAYLHGHKNLSDPMEQVLEGLEEGASFDETLPNAFGQPSGRDPIAVRKRDLPKSVRDRVAVGVPFAAEAGDGSTHQLWITAVKGSQVWVTTDHPLAGKTLRFQGSVTGVREATQTELEHGHAHGVDGHHSH